MAIRKKAKAAYHHGDLRNAAIAAAVAHIGKTRDTSFTLRELAAMLRVSSTALYRHFPSKRAILAAIAEVGFIELRRRAQAREDAAGDDPAQALFQHGMEYVRLALDSPGSFRVMFQGDVRELDEFPALRAARDASYDDLRRVVARCAKDGQVRDLWSIDDVALAMWAGAHGTASLLVEQQLGPDVLHIESREAALEVAGKLLGMLGQGMFQPPRETDAASAVKVRSPQPPV